MMGYRLDLLEVGERAARAEDDWGWAYMGARDEVEATERGLTIAHRCAHCGQEGGH
jgi:hypothetical protein